MRARRVPPIAVLLTATLAMTAAGCGGTPDEPTAAAVEPIATTGGAMPGDFVELASPAADGAATPSLFATEEGKVLMSWQEPVGSDGDEPTSTRRGRFALRFATLEGDVWTNAQTVTESEEFFVNWADFPVIIETGGTLVTHWLERNGGRGTSYDINISRSFDGGVSWTEPVVPHHDSTPTEHGFVSLVPEADGGFSAVWLDGRAFADPDSARQMSLRGTRFAADGTQGGVELLDPRICECCQTSAAYVAGNLIAVYRDRSENEIRDMYSVRRTADGWQEPVRVSHDNWEVRFCPVNGPAIVGGETAGAVAWFSLHDGAPEIKVSFTRDGGEHFEESLLLDSGPATGGPSRIGGPADGSEPERFPDGRVAIAWVGEDTVAVTWIVTSSAGAEIAMRTADLDGNVGPLRTIAATSSDRASGFPRIAHSGDRLIIAWTEPGGSPSLHTAAVQLPLH